MSVSASGTTAEGDYPVPAREAAPAIRVDGVTKIFVTDSGMPVCALNRVSFDVRPGEFVSLVGPSGCGKSTLLSLVAGLNDPTEGALQVNGHAVRGPQTDVGLVFQSDVLLEWRSALDNVLLQAEARSINRTVARQSAMRLLERMGLKGFERVYPKELSGGMRQRVAICRALLHEPEVLLMDEPFGALDALTRDQLGVDLAHLWDTEHRTALFITHDIGEAVFLSDRTVVMTPHPGEIETIVDIPLPRPRRIEMRHTPEFAHTVGVIRDRFVSRGVLHD
jgi:NitT/TauT family transport system ATP-binding protein